VRDAVSHPIPDLEVWRAVETKVRVHQGRVKVLCHLIYGMVIGYLLCVGAVKA
jgi:hypothetical protein